MATSNITISPQLQQTPRPDIGDLVVCRIISPKEHSYWVVKEVSMVDSVGYDHACVRGWFSPCAKQDVRIRRI